MTSTLGPYIRQRRLQLGLSQHELAVRAGQGTTQVHISRLEIGATTLPRWERLIALADALGVTPGELLLQAGVITATDLQPAAQPPEKLSPEREIHPRPFIQPPVGLIGKWETAAVFTCS